MMKFFASAAVLACAAVTTVASDTAETYVRGLKRDSAKDWSTPVLILNGTGEELIEPEQITATGKTVVATLRFGIVEYQGPAYTTKVRAYNGGLPGPTIRVKPGDQLHLRLVNDLTEPKGYLKNNEFQHPNQTNIHTHGPHISGENPGDNVFEEIKESGLVGYAVAKTGKNVGPKEFYRYRYKFDGNHMPGTMWYHPHLHGSTALQTSTASGMLIIEDPKDYPLFLKDMPEVQMMIYRLEIGEGLDANATCNSDNLFSGCGEGGLSRFSAESGDLVSNWTEGEGFTMTNHSFDLEQIFNTGVWMPNFQFQPKKTMKRNTWYRFRMALAVVDRSVVMELSNNTACEMKLLAKDGVYVKVDPTNDNDNVYGPRNIKAIFLSPGNRADVAIRCIGNADMIQITEGTSGELDPKVSEDKLNPGQGTIFSIVVTEGPDEGSNAPVNYDDYEIATPCYQADLTGVEPDDFFYLFYSSRGEPMSVTLTTKLGNFTEVPWIDDQTPIRNLTLGSVIKMTFGTAGAHPHHQHINHFQLQELESSCIYENMSNLTKTYYKSGDWHDTLQWPEFIHPNCSETTYPPGFIFINVKWAVNQFGGRMTFHCHRLNHEDLGMIAFFQIDGEEGTLVNTTGIGDTCLSPAGKGNSGNI